MAKKGQKFVTYSFELKKKAIEMRLQGMTKQKVADLLGITDLDRLKVWMRRYKQMGDFGLMDHRGKRTKYVDEDRYLKRLEMENAVLKKWLAITKAEVYQRNIGSSTSFVKALASQSSVKKSVSREADITRTEEAQRRIEDYIHFYNNSRPQRKLNKLTPVEYRNQLVV